MGGWLRSAPGARSVLHHVIIRLDETGEARRADGAASPGSAACAVSAAGAEEAAMFFQAASAVWGLGSRGTPRILPLGLARHLPAGADLVLNSHLHPSGKEESEKPP